MVADVLDGVIAVESEPKTLHQEAIQAGLDDRACVASLTTLDNAVRTLRLRHPSTKDSSGESKRDSSGSRITFVDYLIKPVQRICKYPLLLDQLLSNNPARTPAQGASDSQRHEEFIVKSASQAMRRVASSVDEARHRQDAAMQTALIASRMFLANPAPATPSDSSTQGLSPEFLSSLGTCLLAGALDIMHHHPLKPIDLTSSFKARYFGAFLYPGGYLILVKVAKGRRYEPRHWFNLADFAISRVEEDEGESPALTH